MADTEDSFTTVTAKALDAAKKAFEDYISGETHDPSYWDIRFTAWLLYVDTLKRGERVEIETRGSDE